MTLTVVAVMLRRSVAVSCLRTVFRPRAMLAFHGRVAAGGSSNSGGRDVEHGDDG